MLSKNKLEDKLVIKANAIDGKITNTSRLITETV